MYFLATEFYYELKNGKQEVTLNAEVKSPFSAVVRQKPGAGA